MTADPCAKEKVGLPDGMGISPLVQAVQNLSAQTLSALNCIPRPLGYFDWIYRNEENELRERALERLGLGKGTPERLMWELKMEYPQIFDEPIPLNESWIHNEMTKAIAVRWNARQVINWKHKKRG